MTQLVPLVSGDVEFMITVSEISYHHEFHVDLPGHYETQHTSLLLDLTHHNSYTQHHLVVKNATNNMVKLSVTGGIVGPMLVEEMKTSVR